MKQKIKDLFREYYCQYLTTDKFASDHNLDLNKARRIIKIGRNLHNLEAQKIKAINVLIADFKKSNPEASYADCKHLNYRLNKFTLKELNILKQGSEK